MVKKFKVSIIIIVVAITVCGSMFFGKSKKSFYEENGLKYISKVEGKDFYVYSQDKWEKKFLRGVNIGAAIPGHFPGELAITKEQYLRWFREISDMNAEVIRVYTTLKPEFYDALYEFNKHSKKTLYLLQGVWINEDDISKLNDAYADNGKIENQFINDATNLVDIFHGKASLPEKQGFASGKYTKDISEYVIGWVLGIEWDPYFVDGTNKNNPEKNSYSGEFLHTEGASPFETFLCEVGDKVLDYEASKYNVTRALSYTNWLTTDMLSHPNEPDVREDMAVVNTENIKKNENFKSGLFASYNIYPYFPEFLNYQKDYINFKDEQGNINTYKAYLQDLIKKHTTPVLVGEFGVPASRGIAHESKYSGYNQGNIDETEQGKINTSLLKDIYDEGYCGALVFTWQDEWFKRTWNTMEFDLPEQRIFWSNPQTNEQEFGLMAFDPGKEKSICYVDGEISDWNEENLIYTSNDIKLYVKSDEKYMYLMVKAKNFDFNKDSLIIPVDTIQEQGNTKDISRNISFERPADFLIQIDNEKNSKIMVDSYYDSFYYLFSEKLNIIEKNSENNKKGNGIFNPMYQCLSKGNYLPEDKKEVPFKKYETGVLKFGDANPNHENYNSLTDFAYKDENIEIRIPWQLLNVMDPSTKSIISDLYTSKSIKAEKVDGMYFGAGILKKELTNNELIKMNYYTWDGWTMPTYHERLKPSYYILKDAFRDLD